MIDNHPDSYDVPIYDQVENQSLTMRDDMQAISWVDQQRQRMLAMVRDWSRINSYSRNLDGLAAMCEALASAFSTLDGDIKHVTLPAQMDVNDHGQEVARPVGNAIAIRHEANDERLRVLLTIHMDTVYPPTETEHVTTLDDDGRILRGPGVTDAKGGLAVMLVALEALQRSPAAKHVSWQVLINPDEEIGSPSSAELLAESAGRHDLGLLFEPALDDAGTLAASRKGSGNFTMVVRGRSAHAGRSFEKGRNAVVAAATMAGKLAALNRQRRDITVNVASLRGGDALNVVPDLAICRVNIRTVDAADQAWASAKLREIVDATDQLDGIRVTLHGSFHCPPKPLDTSTKQLIDHVTACGRALGLAIEAKPTGGVCDGNKLAAAGLPNIDTLGVRGGAIHSPDEYLIVDSLTERAKLTACLLRGLADGSLPWRRRPNHEVAAAEGRTL